MSFRGKACRSFVLLIGLAIPITASAVPTTYFVQPFESSIGASASGFLTVDADPDPLDQYPDFYQMTGNTSTTPSFSSQAVVDVGLPGNFDDGANGITFSTLSIIYADAVSGQVLGGVPLPTGSTPQLAGAFFDIDGFSIVLDSPFSAALTPGVNPNEYLWAGTANVTVSGTLAATFEVPTVQTVTTPPQPFSQSLTVALAGTFSGDATSTEVTVGIPTDDLQNLNLSVPPQSETLDLGIAELSLDFSDFILADVSGAVIYRNNTVPIPEPGTAALLAMGLVGLAARKRNG